MDAFSWNIHTGMKSGTSSSDKGSFEIEGVFNTSMELPKNQAAVQDINLQLADVTKLDVVFITSSIYDKSVEVKGDGSVYKLSGPLLLFGDAIAEFSGSLTKLTVQNKHLTDKANLQILIGRKLS